jgi:hypothetical protein
MAKRKRIQCKTSQNQRQIQKINGITTYMSKGAKYQNLMEHSGEQASESVPTEGQPSHVQAAATA